MCNDNSLRSTEVSHDGWHDRDFDEYGLSFCGVAARIEDDVRRELNATARIAARRDVLLPGKRAQSAEEVEHLRRVYHRVAAAAAALAAAPTPVTLV